MCYGCGSCFDGDRALLRQSWKKSSSIIGCRGPDLPRNGCLGGNDEQTMASMFLTLCTVTSNMTTYNDFFVSSSGGIVMTIVVALKPNIALLWSPIVMRCDGSSRIG